VIPLLVLLAGIGPCKKDNQSVTASADAKLKNSDLPGARTEYDKIVTGNPQSVYAAIGAAYSDVLVGDYQAADAKLAGAEAKANEQQLPEIKMRRAIVALRAGNLDGVKAHGKASGMPAGKLLAAEVHLADLEEDEAVVLLNEAASAGGVVGETANKYLEMVQSEDQILVGLAEATALWSLGDRSQAVEAAEELVKSLPDDQEDKSEQLLVWAGRAVTSGHPDIAESLLDAISFPPEGQAWRVQATRGMVAIAQGNTEEGFKTFENLAEGGAPADGMADALATAASLTQDKADARRLAGGVQSNASAMGLYKAGAVGAARKAAPSGSLADFLESQ
jgi:tetratricopeptide (TPR) repeat protein